ncbi:hypothetical protein BB561_005261 [Smittium simulii]|uniref:Uncharacterized protein n=1 Tax=Smittium simulii TaxID=133385 RepID=A0A2T9YB93_9FUNG|nr:hypothetical protein BB561_005261 [Smittium simulii]
MGCAECRGFNGDCCLLKHNCNCPCHIDCTCIFCETVKLVNRNPHVLSTELKQQESKKKIVTGVKSSLKLGLLSTTKSPPILPGENPKKLSNKRFPTRRTVSNPQTTLINPRKSANYIRNWRMGSKATQQYNYDLFEPPIIHNGNRIENTDHFNKNLISLLGGEFKTYNTCTIHDHSQNQTIEIPLKSSCVHNNALSHAEIPPKSSCVHNNALSHAAHLNTNKTTPNLCHTNAPIKQKPAKLVLVNNIDEKVNTHFNLKKDHCEDSDISTFSSPINSNTNFSMLSIEPTSESPTAEYSTEFEHKNKSSITLNQNINEEVWDEKFQK